MKAAVIIVAHTYQRMPSLFSRKLIVQFIGGRLTRRWW